MKSLGVIETRGLVTAIQAVDAACKAAGVRCIGYRKVGSGLVSVCFEGEISAIHTAIEHGVAVVGGSQLAHSLVIARPERSVIAALSNLKGQPPRAAATLKSKTNAEPGVGTTTVAPETTEETQITGPAPQPIPQPTAHKPGDKSAVKKGRKT